MMLFNVHFIPDQISLSYEFGVSREKYKDLRCLFVAISDGEHIGLGEATEFMADVYQANIELMMAQQAAVQRLIAECAGMHPQDFWLKLDQLLQGFPFLKCAIDVAYWDLYARRQGLPLYQVLNLSATDLPRSNLSIGLAEPKVMRERILQALHWPALKIKLGSDNDIKILQMAREVTDQPIIVDVNCGWTFEEAKEKVPLFDALGVTEIEQPLPVDHWQEMAELKASSQIIFTADESCTSLVSIDRCSLAFDKCNVKLMKSGGITPALQLIKRARELDMQVMMGCMPESYVGISAICQLSSLLDSIEVDSITMVDNSIAGGVLVEKGEISLNQTPGTSAFLKRHPDLYKKNGK
ncbi:dipeptide epimerase [Vibrio sp. Of14-4]|uniref:dipeptide epimerase n=1 Tax=Vibrio sp. Of14-4 TaxID=2724878 RepID=UPI001EF3A642|nr:dipeptide epimerase [Vibrio sp. Of14-4]MCG7490556.1 dipeptide epimerase [Vibrio sp. Of14-4]